uniref:DUF1308 domain-containing protein n=1 Tax=Cannabis sativa TaxID=3483 RepID=A0A803P9U6_CANSA
MKENEELELAKKRCINVIERLSSLISTTTTTKINPSSQQTLLKLARSELASLSCSSNPRYSFNIGHIEAVLHILQQPFITGVSRVCKSISVNGEKTCDSVYVDVVCILNRNPVWIIVSDRNPNYISWDESHSSKGLKFRIEKLLAVARSSVALKPSSVILFFANGISEVIYEKLRLQFGAVEFGLEFTVFDFDFFEDLEEEISVEKECEYVNFDTTALIAVVSGISNGGCEKLLGTPEADLREKYKSNYEFVIGQVMSEIEKPIHVELGSVISGKRGMICQSVCSEFKELVSMCGGPNEKLRADHLLGCLKVVVDCPSERMMSLPTTRKLAMKNKVVFGTGDYWRAPTLTANMAFVRAISQTGMSLFTIGHRPRALIGD